MTGQLAAEFRSRLTDYVLRLEATQTNLLALYRRKRAALTTADAELLRQLELPERQAGEQLQSLAADRQQMIARAGQLGRACGSLMELLANVGGDPALRERMRCCQQRTAALRREGWVQWVVTRRSLSQTSALLELIAHRGDRPPTYDQAAAGGGGTLLDASA